MAEETGMLLEFFRWMDNNLPGTFYLRESTYGFSFLLTAHVVFMCLFLGLTIMMDLRLAGIGNLRTPAAEINKRLLPWLMLFMFLVSATGIALFYSKPLSYYGKGFLWIKMGLIVLGGINAGIIHLITRKSDAAWDSQAAKFAGVASLVLWAGVLITGRLVAYEWFTTEYF
jgi:hypothetical protein